MIYLMLILSLAACATYYQPTQTITINQPINHLDISATNDKIVMASTNTLYIYTHNHHYELTQQSDMPIDALELTQKDRLFVVGGNEAKLFVHWENGYNLSSPMLIGEHMDRIDVGCINEEQTMISLGYSSYIEIYERKDDEFRLIRNYYGNGIRYHSFTDDGRTFLVGTQHNVSLYSTIHFNLIIQLETSATVKFNGDQSYLLVATDLEGNQTQLKIYEKVSSNYTYVRSLILQGTYLQGSITNNKKYLIFNNNNKLVIQPFSTNQPQQLINQTISLYDVSDDGQYLVTVSSNHINIYINCNWNTTGGYFYHPSSAQCEPCSSIGCETCTQIECESCFDGYWLHHQDNILTCTQCPQPCLKCINNNECTECVNNHFLMNGSCQSCQIEGCMTCASTTACRTCDSNYYRSGNICKLCTIKGCVNCVSASQCSACDSSLNYGLEGRICTLKGGAFDWQMALILSFLLSVFIGFVIYKRTYMYMIVLPLSSEPEMEDSSKPNIQQ